MKTVKLAKTNEMICKMIETEDYSIFFLDSINEKGNHKLEHVSLVDFKFALKTDLKMPDNIDEQILNLYKVLMEFKIYKAIPDKPERIVRIVDYLLECFKAEPQSEQVSMGFPYDSAVVAEKVRQEINSIEDQDQLYKNQFDKDRKIVSSMLSAMSVGTNISINDLQILISPHFLEILAMAEDKNFSLLGLSNAALNVYTDENQNSFMELFEDLMREID